MALALSHSARSRDVFLYDTFEAMSEPTDLDVDLNGNPASEALTAEIPNDHSVCAVAALEVVRTNMISTGYPQNQVQYVQGRVEDTIPPHCRARSLSCGSTPTGMSLRSTSSSICCRWLPLVACSSSTTTATGEEPAELWTSGLRQVRALFC